MKENLNDLIERLAALEHDQWVYWSKNLSVVEQISPERLERWKSLWVPYSDLPEDEKETDRQLARKVITLLNDSSLIIIPESDPRYIDLREIKTVILKTGGENP